MQKIIIENFGPIKKGEIELRDFVVLIGEQASGKSTIAKLVYFFNSLSEEFIIVASQINTNDLKIILEDLAKATSNKFVRYFGFPAFLPEFSIKFYFSVELDNWVQLRLEKKSNSQSTIHSTYSPNFNNNYNKQFDILWKKFQTTPSETIRIKEGDSEEIKKQKRLTQILIIKEAGDSIYNLLPDAVYFPASRNISVQFSNLFRQTFYGTIVSRLESKEPMFNVADLILIRSFIEHTILINDRFSPHKTFEKMLSDLEAIGTNLNKDAISTFMLKYPKILKGRYSLNGDGERIFFGGNQKDSILVEKASSGQQESLRILQDLFLIVVYKSNFFRVVEEPEAHLFPTGQKSLVELFALASNATNSKMFITTHSPYVLSVLANLLYASKVKTLGAASAKEIEEKTGMSELTWLDKEKFVAYTMDDGTAKSIFDREDSGMINQNYLDEVSEELGREFQILHKLRLKQIRETTSK